MIRIGIPRALLYYQYYPLWHTFFRELGAELVVSPPTTQIMLSKGSSRVVTDTCLPVKVFLGHVLSLVDECEYIFIPSIRSVKKKAYNCSKFLGLPDMTRAVVPEAPPILDIDIDINKGKRSLYLNIYKAGRHFNWNPLKIKRAFLIAWQAHLSYWQMMSQQSITAPKAINELLGQVTELDELRNQESTIMTIAVIGHPYLVYDELINHRLLHRLEQAGCVVLTPEMVNKGLLEVATTELVGKSPWTYGDEVAGAGAYYLGTLVNGVIGVMAFGCGPDSLMMDMVRRRAVRLNTVPFMNLTLEEHTAEAGIVTRVEAFLDMIQRRMKRQETLCV